MMLVAQRESNFRDVMNGWDSNAKATLNRPHRPPGAGIPADRCMQLHLQPGCRTTRSNSHNVDSR